MTGHLVGTGRRWLLLAYRLPREPSTPRIAVWRKLDQLGAVRLGDGLVWVPADARTSEQIGWIAEDARQAGGTASATGTTPRRHPGSTPLSGACR